ncbi:MAG TPA: hypothetical protein VK031_09150 [Tissierellaceae bacterium]|nr:hypothetical protein [Tissierellaceae bacterium]
MSRGLNYARKFIIFKKEYSNLPDTDPKGHGRLELKGKSLSIYLNIDNAESNNYYDVILIGSDNIHRIGKIYTEENKSGKGEFNLQYRELVEIGFPLERINGILILRDEKVLLGGYFSQDDGTIEDYIKGLKEREIKEKSDYQEEIELSEEEQDEIDIEPEKVQEKEIEDEVIQEEEIEDKKTERIEQEKAEPNKITKEAYTETMEEVFERDKEIEEDKEKEETINIFKEFPKTFMPEIEEVEVDQTVGYILNILNYFPYVEPFALKLKGYDWWKIDVDDPHTDKSFLPYFNYILDKEKEDIIADKSTTAGDLMKEFGHYLFGFYRENRGVRFFVYGVPGDFTIDQHPLKGATGFNTWFEAKDSKGYWLLYIEAATGRIIYPINPMIPEE